MKQAIKNLLSDANIKFVRILWCDNANVIRAKAPYVTTLDHLPSGVGISAAQQALPVMYDSVVADSGLGPVGEIQLSPDWSTLTVLPYAPGYAQVLSDMIFEGRPWEHCPRTFLKEQMQKLQARELHLKAAFENEFYLLSKTPERITPSDNTVFAATQSMNISGEVILAMAEALAAQGLEVETYYPESGPGQHELTVRYQDALAAADQQIVFRETIRGVASNHDLIASFLPKIFEDKAGSGCHLNLSLWREDKNITADPAQPTGLSQEAQGFIAGVLRHLPALTALTIPSNNSFRRIKPHFWVGAFTVWGYDNREAAVRVFRGLNGRGPARFEVKTVDATANPYLALGAVIAAGLQGIDDELEFPAEVTVDPARLPESERQARKISRLPKTLGEAIQALRNDDVLLTALGENRAKAYLAVRESEWQALGEASLQEEVDLLLERY